MTGLTDLLHVAASGLSAATTGLQTVANNTANANTAGYSLQSVDQTELPGSAGGPGTGVKVSDIRRAFDRFVAQELVRSTSANQAAQAVQTNAQSLTALFPVASGGADGLGAGLDDFFAALGKVAQDPADTAAREALLGSARSLVGRFNSLGRQLSDGLAGIDGQITDAVRTVNSLAQQIGSLNRSIVGQTAAGGVPANGLLDQRDELIRQLGEKLDLTVLHKENGAIDVYTAGGAALVAADNAYTLSAKPDSYGDGALAVIYDPAQQDVTGRLSGGDIGGLLTSRRSYAEAQDQVGGIAASLAASVNRQQSLGLDLNGRLGGPLLSAAGPAVYAAASNTGSGTLTATITDAAGFVPGDFILTRTAAGYDVTNVATGAVAGIAGGPTLSFDGITLTVAGTVALGDSFKLVPTATAAQTLRLETDSPASIAAASAYVVTPGVNGGKVLIASRGPLASADLATGAVVIAAASFGDSLSVKFTSQSDFEVLASDNTVLASGTLDPSTGAQIAIAYPSPAPAGQYAAFDLSPGQAAPGDTFALTPGGTGSSGNATALAGLADEKLMSGKTLADAYAALVSQVGARGQEADVAAQAAQGVLTQAQKTQQSVSGVNLDEQAAELISYQQAYQAAATVIAAGQALFENLINAVRG
jgi:flagellar hook-associated protein 1 FlgK